jgi:O-antigen ligase
VEGFLIGYAAFLFQARTIYLQIFVLVIFFFAFRRQVLGKSAIGMTMIALALLIIPLAGIEIQGRLGQKISYEFVLNHIQAIGGVESEGLTGSARGVSLRFGWWQDLIGRWLSSFETFVLGIGFGMPLTDFTSASGAIVREPHNSYLSVIGRTGITGAIAFVWMHFFLLRAWWRTYRTCLRNRWREGENRLLILMVFFVLMWVAAMGEDAFEKPYFAIPYYFFWGLVLKMSWFLKAARAAKDRARYAPPRVAPQNATHEAPSLWPTPSGRPCPPHS